MKKAVTAILSILMLVSCMNSKPYEPDVIPSVISYELQDAVFLGNVEHSYHFIFPHGYDLTQVKASFSFEGKTIKVGGKTQNSGDIIDLSKPVEYCIEGGSRNFVFKVYAYDFALPTVFITTPGKAPVQSKDVWMDGATASVYEPESGTFTDLSPTSIKGRGNTTFDFPKKPFTFKLDKKQQVLGMPKGKRWDFIANWMDRTCMRNAVSYELARHCPALPWTPRGQFVEVILNGVHQGNYQLLEHIKVAKDRVNVSKLDPEKDITGGYLLEIDVYYDQVNKFKSKYFKLPVNVNSQDEPGDDITYIKDYFNEMERLIASDDITSSGYRDMLDIDSFIDCLFVYEMSMNSASNGPKDRYMYKDAGGKLYAGPVWDFDWSTYVPSRTSSWIEKKNMFYPSFFKDPVFVARLKEKWNAQKSEYIDVANNYIPVLARQLKESVDRDKKKWPMSANESGSVNGDQDMTFDKAVSRLQQTLLDKIAWMDTQFAKL